MTAQVGPRGGRLPTLSGTLERLPADALLKLIALHRNDARSDKIDLGVGVYRDEDGQNWLPWLAKIVSVITTRWEGRRIAMAATAVEGLSLDPPSMLICVNKSASLAAPLRGGTAFAINLLGAEHHELPSRCSAPWQGEERFAIGDWKEWGDIPVLEDSQATFLCVPDALHSYGSHYVAIGRVLRVSSREMISPMIFADGKFHVIAGVAQ